MGGSGASVAFDDVDALARDCYPEATTEVIAMVTEVEAADRWRSSGGDIGMGTATVRRSGRRAGWLPVALGIAGAALGLSVRGGRVREAAALDAEPWRAFLSPWAEPVGGELDTATKYPKRVRRVADQMDMVLVPAGTFQMGAVPEDDRSGAPKHAPEELPRHAVTLTRAYYLDAHEVTNEQFGRFTAATRYVTTAERVGEGWIRDERGMTVPVKGATWRAPLSDGGRLPEWERHPVVLVSWDDADAYARWARVGLPTEAQFERALRGGAEGALFPWGGTLPPPRGAGNFLDGSAKRAFPKSPWAPIDGYEDGFARTAPVKSFGANPLGLFDLSGNVSELCADRFERGYYGRSPPSDPLGGERGSARVTRGSSWGDVVQGLRLSSRKVNAPTNVLDDLGFRCAKTLDAPP
ncbi:MAG: formylglycine-generating enzyme family protein [Planctomycetes bacterium]|nr:formylglycine-generating enzyme family protein [Planctomycetota bacterium]